MNLATERTSLQTALATITSLNCYDKMPANPEVPCAIVVPDSGTYHAALDSTSNDLMFRVLVLVQWGDPQSAQDALDGYVSTGTASSVPDALGSTDAYDVTGWDSYGTTVLETDANPVTYGSVVFHVGVFST